MSNSIYTKTDLLTNGWTEALIKKWNLKHKIGFSVREDSDGNEHGIKYNKFNAKIVNEIALSQVFINEFANKSVLNEVDQLSKLGHIFARISYNQFQCDNCNNIITITRNKISKYFINCDLTCDEIIIKSIIE
jgi:hypothetical protein